MAEFSLKNTFAHQPVWQSFHYKNVTLEKLTFKLDFISSVLLLLLLEMTSET
jgi:hypothetical protein